MSERAALLKRLSAVKSCIEKLEAEVDTQKMIITGASGEGADTAEAGKLLRSLELDLQTYLAEAEQILDALDKLPLFEDVPPPGNAKAPPA